MGEAIRFLRQQRQLTQEQLAEKAGIHPTEISHIERGRRNLSYLSLRKISKGLQMPFSELAARIESIESGIEGERSPESVLEQPGDSPG